MEDRNGNLKKEEKEKEKIIHEYYTNTFTLVKNSPKCSFTFDKPEITVDETEKKLLTKTLEQSEIKISISELKEGKSPGIDGIPLEFYKTFWEDLKEILTELFIFILESNTIPNEAKTSTISQTEVPS